MDIDPSSFAERFPDRMNPSDAVMWEIERDPVLRSTITAIAILDRRPDWDRLVRRMEYASRVIPRMRQRAVDPPLRLGAPRWALDPEFDLAYHLRRVGIAGPGALRELLDLAAPLSMSSFDRTRPLWEFTLVDGLEDGRAALIQKIHHTVTDGIGGIELALAILDDRRDAKEPPLPSAPVAERTSARPSSPAALLDCSAAYLRPAAHAPLVVGRAAVGVATHPLGSIRRAGELARSIGRTLAPVPPSASPLLTERSLRRRFDAIDIRLADVKAAAHVAGCSTNDAFLAAVVEGLRRYHTRHDADVEELRLTMPISLRRAGDALGGNHFAPARFTVPTTIDDPLERMRTLGAVARRWRAEPAFEHTDAIASVLDHLPATVTSSAFGAMLKHVDAVATNVPGLPSRSYLAGAEVVREYAFAPPTGAAVNIAFLSHVDTACIGVVTDAAAVPDDDVFTACLVEGFDDVLGVAEHHASRTA